MAVLTEADKQRYFPSINLTGNVLIGFLARVQTYAESDWGANRRLELQDTTDIVNVNFQVQTAQFPLIPVNSVSLVEARQRSQRNRFGRVIRTTGWVTLEPNTYQLNEAGSGRIHLNFVEQFYFGRESGIADQLRITYNTGFEFDENFDSNGIPQNIISKEAIEIKTAIGSFAEYLAAIEGLSQIQTGNDNTVGRTGPVKRIESRQEYSLEVFSTYGNILSSGGKTAGENIESLAISMLNPLKKWQPRRWR